LLVIADHLLYGFSDFRFRSTLGRALRHRIVFEQLQELRRCRRQSMKVCRWGVSCRRRPIIIEVDEGTSRLPRNSRSGGYGSGHQRLGGNTLISGSSLTHCGARDPTQSQFTSFEGSLTMWWQLLARACIVSRDGL
jgi:hypothetical protein